MPSTKKLIHYRAGMFDGPRRKKPPVRELNREVKERAKAEKDLIHRLMQDADFRRSLLGPTGAREPFAVYNDFDHPDMHFTEINISNLPTWEILGELHKLHLLFIAALEGGGYAFTARVRPDLEAKWTEEGRNPRDVINSRMDKAMRDHGLNDLEYANVLESRTRSGTSRAALHLHGMFLASNPMIATRFQQVLEKAISIHPAGKAAAGYKPSSGKPIKIEPVYDKVEGTYGRGRWVNYMTKNTLRWDERFAKKTYTSRTATQVSRELWALIREDPL